MSGPVGATSVDLALAAFRDQGRWEVQGLTQHHLVDVETLAAALRRLPGEGGSMALVSAADDFVLVRVVGESTRVVLSDSGAADDWDLADDVLDFLGDDGSDDEEDDDGLYLPPGDLDLLADLGVSADDLVELVNDDDLDADEMLSEIADQLGFGELFDDVAGLTTA